MDNIIDVIVSAIPWIEGLVSQVRVVVTALPYFGQVLQTSTFIILAVGAYYVLNKTGVIRIHFGGGEDDDNW